MASTTSVSYTQALASAAFPYTVSAFPSTVSRIARDHLRQTPPSSPLTLVGNEAQYDFPEKLTEAYQLLQSEEFEEAKELFGEILQNFRDAEFEENSLIEAHCHLGFAYSLPLEEDRKDEAEKALRALNSIYDKLKTLNPAQCSLAYLELRLCYRRVLPLIPEAEPRHKEIKDRIRECALFILPSDEFNEKVREADLYAAKMEPTIARQLYQEALDITLKLPLFSTLAGITCRLHYASTFIRSNEKKTALLAEVEEMLARLYEVKEETILHFNWTREKFFATLVELYTDLHAQMPEEPYEAWQRIQNLIAFYKADLPKPDETARRKVTPGFPRRSASPAALFARFLIFGLAAVGIIALYRRFVTRVG
jgi:hypothetical protein